MRAETVPKEGRGAHRLVRSFFFFAVVQDSMHISKGAQMTNQVSYRWMDIHAVAISNSRLRRLLTSPFAMVSDPGNHHPLVGMAGPARLETTLGL